MLKIKYMPTFRNMGAKLVKLTITKNGILMNLFLLKIYE